MKTVIKLLALLALALATFSLPTTARAGDVFNFRGKVASVQFFNPSGCIATSVTVFASEEIFQNPPGPRDFSSGVVTFVFRFDNCTGTLLLSAIGFASLADPDLQIRGDLDSATLNATVNVHDFVSDSFFDIFVDLTWSGTGPISQSNSHFHDEVGGCIINGHSNGATRPAEASGSVSDGETNFASAPFSFGVLHSGQDGSVEASCG